MGRNKLYKRSADAIALFHGLWALFLLIGAVAVLFFPDYARVQIGILSITLLAQAVLFGVCPLTRLEERLRRKVDPHYSNNGSFMATYLNHFFGTDFTPQKIRVVTGVLYVLSYTVAIFMLVIR